MNILFLGGKRFLGKKILLELIKNKNLEIDVVYRKKKPNFKYENLKFVNCDRNKSYEIKSKLNNKNYQIIFDNNCYTFNNFNKVLKNVKNTNYVYVFTSTVMTFLLDKSNKNISYKKNLFSNLPTKVKKYIYEKNKIEKFLKKKKRQFLILKLNNLIGKNDHSGKTNFLFNLSLNDLTKYKVSDDDKIQFAFIDDVVKTIYKEIIKLKKYEPINKTITISSKPYKLSEIINLKSRKDKRLSKNINFINFPFVLNFVINNKIIFKQKHSSLINILKKI